MSCSWHVNSWKAIFEYIQMNLTQIDLAYLSCKRQHDSMYATLFNCSAPRTNIARLLPHFKGEFTVSIKLFWARAQLTLNCSVYPSQRPWVKVRRKKTEFFLTDESSARARWMCGFWASRYAYVRHAVSTGENSKLVFWWRFSCI